MLLVTLCLIVDDVYHHVPASSFLDHKASSERSEIRYKRLPNSIPGATEFSSKTRADRYVDFEQSKVKTLILCVVRKKIKTLDSAMYQLAMLFKRLTCDGSVGAAPFLCDHDIPCSHCSMVCRTVKCH